MPSSILRRTPRITRAKFDQRGCIYVQLRKRSRVKIRLTRAVRHASLRDLSPFPDVKNLHHHRRKSDAWQRHSSARHGQEEGRRRPARDQKCVAFFFSQPARASCLGIGVEKICARPREFARIEDNQQTRRLRGVEKSRRYLTRSRNATRLSGSGRRGDLISVPSPKSFFRATLGTAGEVRDREGAIVGTRGACAPRNLPTADFRVFGNARLRQTG